MPRRSEAKEVEGMPPAERLNFKSKLERFNDPESCWNIAEYFGFDRLYLQLTKAATVLLD